MSTQSLNGQPTRLLAAGELADALGMARASIYRLAETGQIPSFKIGGRRLFRLEDVLAHTESRAESRVDTGEAQ